MDERAQSALTDAVLFFLLMSVASTLLLAYSSLTFDATAALDREAGLRYAADTRLAILRVTLPNASYDGRELVLLGMITVERWLLEQLAVREAGVPGKAFEEGNARVRDLARAAVRPDYAFALAARTASITVWISVGAGEDSEVPYAHYDSSWAYPLPTNPSAAATITLTLWPDPVSPAR